MLACEILIIKVRVDFKMEEPRTRGLRAVRLGDGGGGALGLRRGQVLSQQGRHGVQYAVRGLLWYNIGGQGEEKVRRCLFNTHIGKSRVAFTLGI